MPFHDRRAAGRRRAWGRGPIILKLESLERRALMAAHAPTHAARPRQLLAAVSSNVSDWNGPVEVEGRDQPGRFARPPPHSRSSCMRPPSAGSTSIPSRSAR